MKCDDHCRSGCNASTRTGCSHSGAGELCLEQTENDLISRSRRLRMPHAVGNFRSTFPGLPSPRPAPDQVDKVRQANEDPPGPEDDQAKAVPTPEDQHEQLKLELLAQAAPGPRVPRRPREAPQRKGEVPGREERPQRKDIAPEEEVRQREAVDAEEALGGVDKGGADGADVIVGVGA